MQARIDSKLCQGHAMCLLACPEMFELSDEDGHAYLKSTEIPPELADKVERAVESCPEGAISIF